jgi:Ca2+-binding EF-hand superfamily protein
MSIIDIEEDGTIDWESFEEFFSKTIEEDVYEENNMKILFIKLDQAKTGLVKSEDFVKGILEALNTK